ncbi:MAG: polysaccharide deacetylase family protein [Sedimentisphaerales bacterium]|nr:polysaccharide deacetylase family protein [Sedimentisphaerales bacterium]
MRQLIRNMGLYLRKLLIFLIRKLGFIRLIQFINRNKIVILLMHGVMDDKDDVLWTPLRPRLSRDGLEEYVQTLSKYYNFISLPDAVEMLAGRKPVKPYSMVFTFDDGYRNNLTHALPVLRRYKAPATFFVSTGFLNNPRPFWWDRLDYAMQHGEINGREVKICSMTTRLDNSNRETLLESYHKVNPEQMSDPEFVNEFEKIAAQLEQESGCSLSEIQNKDNWSAILTWDEIVKNVNGDVTIGSHTVDHIRLRYVDKETAYEQLVNSKRDIEEHTKKPCLSLCYPYGSFNDEIIGLARKCGYVCGFTTKEGLNRPGDDLMRLRRIYLPVESKNENLLLYTSGISAAKHNMKRRLLKCKFLKIFF